jgi:hypothetical protein
MRAPATASLQTNVANVGKHATSASSLENIEVGGGRLLHDVLRDAMSSLGERNSENIGVANEN